MGNELEKQDQKKTVGAVRESDGFSELSYAITEVRINRSLPGFQIIGTEEYLEEVTLVLKAGFKNHAFFANRYDPKNPVDPSCVSPDGVIGYGFREQSNADNPTAQVCASCVRHGFGPDMCNTQMKVIAWCVEKEIPIYTIFKNQEINPRKGVFAHAINNTRSMGLDPDKVATKFRFEKAPEGPYYSLVLDEQVPYETLVSDPKHVSHVLDSVENAVRQARQLEIDFVKGKLK